MNWTRAESKGKESENEKTLDLPKPECNRCGKCCQAFPLFNVNHERFSTLRDSANERLSGISFREVDASNQDLQGKSWFDFIEPITPEEVEAIGLSPRTFDLSPRIEGEEPRKQDTPHWYKCRLYVVDEDGLGACSIHENRPDVCRNFYPKGDSILSPGYLTLDGIAYEGCSYFDYFDVIQAAKKVASDLGVPILMSTQSSSMLEKDVEDEHV